MVKVGYQGIEGSHSHIAISAFFNAIKQPNQPQHPLFPRTNSADFTVDSVGTDTFASLFSKLSLKQDLDFCLVPIENTRSGTFTQIYDLLLKYQKSVFIVGEFAIHEENALMIHQESPLTFPSQITQISSHPHTLYQCSNLIQSIRTSNPNLILISAEDSAISAKNVRDKGIKDIGVLGHPSIASIYNLKIIKSGVEDSVHSGTRYLLLSSSELTMEQLSFASKMGTIKTSVALVLSNKVGMLHRAISSFALRDINITKMESRPSPRASLGSGAGLSSPWEYVNYVDVEGGVNEEKLKFAIGNLREFAVEVSVFGSYPRFSGISSSSTIAQIGM